MSSILRVLSFIFFVLGFVLFLVGVFLVVVSINNINDLFSYLFICLFGIFLFAIGYLLYDESIYREVY